MEKALVYEIEKYILDLQGNVYPTNAPETSTKPYLVYYRGNTEFYKTLDSMSNMERQDILFNVMASKYADVKRIADLIVSLLNSLPGTSIGDEGQLIEIQDMEIRNVSETFEPELQVHRLIIDFSIWR